MSLENTKANYINNMLNSMLIDVMIIYKMKTLIFFLYIQVRMVCHFEYCSLNNCIINKLD